MINVYLDSVSIHFSFDLHTHFFLDVKKDLYQTMTQGQKNLAVHLFYCIRNCHTYDLPKVCIIILIKKKLIISILLIKLFIT